MIKGPGDIIFDKKGGDIIFDIIFDKKGGDKKGGGKKGGGKLGGLKRSQKGLFVPTLVKRNWSSAATCEVHGYLPT